MKCSRQPPTTFRNWTSRVLWWMATLVPITTGSICGALLELSSHPSWFGLRGTIRRWRLDHPWRAAPSRHPLPWHGFDEKTYEFVSLYRRHFKLPPAARGKHVFVDFEGVMTASTIWINGTRLGEYKGGYTPFSFDLTPHLDFDGENVLAVDVDSSERADIPPFGYEIDYLTFGGIYREVSLRVVPSPFIENMAVRTSHVLTGPEADVAGFITHSEPSTAGMMLYVGLLDRARAIANVPQPTP